MRIPPQQLIEGVARALHEQVLPHVGARTARGQLWAAIDVLRNLAGRVEPATAPLDEESQSAASALATFAAALRTANDAAWSSALERDLAGVPPSPAAARVAALRALLTDAFARLDELPPERAGALRAILGGHLAAQAVRDVSRLQPSLLEEISRG